MERTQCRDPNHSRFPVAPPMDCQYPSAELGWIGSITKSISLAFGTPNIAARRPLPHPQHTLGNGVLQLEKLLFG